MPIPFNLTVPDGDGVWRLGRLGRCEVRFSPAPTWFDLYWAARLAFEDLPDVRLSISEWQGETDAYGDYRPDLLVVTAEGMGVRLNLTVSRFEFYNAIDCRHVVAPLREAFGLELLDDIRGRVDQLPERERDALRVHLTPWWARISRVDVGDPRNSRNVYALTGI